MRHTLVSAHVVLLCVLVLTVPVGAGIDWCDKDPVVELGGTHVQILVSVPEEAVARVSGPVNVEITTPEGIERRLISTDSGFNGHGEAVRFTDFRGHGKGRDPERGGRDGFRTRVRVRVPLSPREGSPPAIRVRVTAIIGDDVVEQAHGTSRGTRLDLLVPYR